MYLVEKKISRSVSTKPSSDSNKPTVPEIRADEILDLFECPFCDQTILAPIKQCENGHLICSGCHSNFLKCRTCQGKLSNLRNLAMEKVAEKIMFLPKHTSEDGLNRLSNLSRIPETWMDNLVDLYECPVCCDTVLPCIQQCENGHLICTSCHSKVSYCPICRESLSSLRNLTMERVATMMMFPCKYRSEGCQIYLRSNEIMEHQHICKFRLYSCFLSDTACSWHGPLNKVIEHLQNSHNNDIVHGKHVEFLIPCSDWHHNYVRVLHCFGQHFVLDLEMGEHGVGLTQCCVQVQLIGSRKQAELFYYRLKIREFDILMDCENEIKVSSKVTSTAEDNKVALREIFDDTILETSAKCDLNIKVTVLKK